MSDFPIAGLIQLPDYRNLSGIFEKDRAEWFWTTLSREPNLESRLILEARLRFHLAWISMYGTQPPFTACMRALDGIVHLIVDCPQGTEQTFKELSADCLQFFNAVGNGTTEIQSIIGDLHRTPPSVTVETATLKRTRYFA
jgi:hypothetical protein